jgi:predicted dehydrogenase
MVLLNATPVLRLGILGASQTAESIHLPALHALPTRFSLTILHDASADSLNRCQKRFNIKEITTSTSDVLNNPDVDLVLNLLPFEYHEQHTIVALEAGKHVMVEVPLTLSIDGLRRIRAATKKGTINSRFEGGPKVFVGCARRYAPCFTENFKNELASLDRIYYARCRNIAGPLVAPASQSSNGDSIDGLGNAYNLSLNLNGSSSTNGSLTVPNTIINTSKFHTLLTDIFGNTDDITSDRIAFARFLGTTGSHDLSLVRESFGYPDAVANISITDPFYSAMFHYTDNTKVEHPFTMIYEAGIDAVPRCDSHLTVYGAGKTITLEYDFPCPSGSGEGAMRVIVEEAETPEAKANGSAENGSNGSNGTSPVANSRIKRTVHTSTVAEAYERQFEDMYSFFSGNVTAKTDTADALNDLKLVRMIFEHYDRQCGTIRTPLG